MLRTIAFAVGCLLWVACPKPGGSDAGPAGAGGGGGGSLPGAGGGTAGGVGGGSGGGGGSVEFDASFPIPDPSLFDAGWVDDGGILVGCEVAPANATTPPECAPSAGGCQSASDCDSGLCLKLAIGGICTSGCGSTTGCPPYWTCQQRWTGVGQQGFCVPAGRAP